MPTRVFGDPLRLALRAQRHRVELSFERRLRVRHEIDGVIALIDASNRALAAFADDVPVAVRERTNELAVVVIEIEMRVTAAARRPNDLRCAFEQSELIVEVDPRVAALSDQLARL